MILNQYQIVLINLDPTKTRPCVILSPVEMNLHLKTIVIAPITSQQRALPTRVEIIYKRRKGWIVLDQIRTIDKRRILKIFGQLQNKEILKTKNLLKETYVD